jgi:type IV pilus assembly protein PilB
MQDHEFFERVGRSLLSYHLISEAELQEVQSIVKERGLSFEHALHEASKVDLPMYKRILEEVSGCVAVDPSVITIDQDFINSMLEILPLQAIAGLKVFPVSLGGNELTLAMPNPADLELITELESTTSLRIKPVVSTYRGIQQAIELNYGPVLREALREIRDLKGTDILDRIQEKKVGEGLEPSYDKFLALVNREYDRAKEDDNDLEHFLVNPRVVAYTQRLMADLILRNCSDIHIEPTADRYRIRSRINGVLRTIHELPLKCGEVVNMRAKTMAGMGRQEYTVPKDGQIGYSPVYGRRVEFRVSCLPTIHGNKTVMRLLEKKNQNIGLDKLLQPDDLAVVQRNIAAPNGLILVTGPTGSGKTSTLYSVLAVLNDEETCVVTAEEPVESEIPGVVQVNCGKDTTFAMALRSFLRQDPDVIMVGEIRDQETADIALKAALTGHLVLSTLHTNDAPTAVMRLLNLDMDPFIVASSLRMVIAQRLMRTLCKDCKKPIKRAQLLENHHPIDVPDVEDLFTRGGCPKCNESGYAGRIGIFEILQGGDEMTDAINRRAALGEIREIAERAGMKNLRQRALEACARGVTTVEEVVRVTAE